MSADECRPVEVDGEVIRVYGGEQMDAESREMFADVVRAAKRRLAAETGLVWGDIAASVSCSFRQWDIWATSGLIKTTGGGYGTPRTITRAEITVLAIMADLVAAGMTPKAAAPLARLLATGDSAPLGSFRLYHAGSTI